MACAASRSTSVVRRASPYSSASLSSSSRTSLVSRALLFRILSISSRSSAELLLLLADLHLLEAREVPQLGLEDRLGLLVGQLEALDEHGLRLVLGAHDADHLVEVQIGDQQAVEDVQPRAHLLEPVLQAPRHSRLAEIQPLEQQLLQAHDARTAVEGDDVEIHAVVALEVGGGEQVRHQLHDVDPVRLRHDHQARRILVIGLVAHELDHRQLFLLHLCRDLLEHLGCPTPGSGSASMTISPSSIS